MSVFIAKFELFTENGTSPAVQNAVMATLRDIESELNDGSPFLYILQGIDFGFEKTCFEFHVNVKTVLSMREMYHEMEFVGVIIYSKFDFEPEFKELIEGEDIIEPTEPDDG